MTFRLKQPLQMLAIAGLISGLAACGGGGGSAVTTLPDSKGVVVSSYIAKAVVTLDINDDGICQATEPKVVSDLQGRYTFPGLGLHMVCSDGGYNTSTNLPVVGQQKAPAGAEVVTALSTLVVALAQSTPGQAPTAAAVAEAQTKLETQLGLPTGSISQDPMAVVATQPKIEQINSSVQVLLQTVADSVSTFAGVQAPGTGASEADKTKYATAVNAVFANAAASVAATLTAPSAAPVDLTTTSAANAAAFVQKAVETTVVKVQSQPAAVTALQAAAPAAAAANITTLSPTNAAAFVASNVAAVVQSVAQSNGTAAAIAAAETQAQKNVTIVNAVKSVVTTAPALFVATGGVAPVSSSTTIAALAQTVLPSSSAVANQAVTVNTTTLSSSLAAAATATGATVNTAAVSTAIATAVSNPPAPPAAVDIVAAPTPVVPPLPAPIVVTGTI